MCLIETVLFEMPYGAAHRRWFVQKLYETGATYGTTHIMDTCSLQILAFCFFVGKNTERSNQPEVLSFSLSFSTTMQYVIYTYMKHLGVRVKEPRSLESKRVRINFLPKIKVLYINLCTLAFLSLLSLYHPPDTYLVFHKIQKSIKTEKEGEEKVKKPRFPSILGPQRRPSRIEAASGE